MFKKTARFTPTPKYRSHGRPFKAQHFTLFALSNHLSHPRFAAVISAKVSKQAVVRNQLKRRLFHFFKGQSLPAVDLTIVANPSAVNLTSAQLQQDLLPLISSVNQTFSLK